MDPKLWHCSQSCRMSTSDDHMVGDNIFLSFKNKWTLSSATITTMSANELRWATAMTRKKKSHSGENYLANDIVWIILVKAVQGINCPNMNSPLLWSNYWKCLLGILDLSLSFIKTHLKGKIVSSFGIFQQTHTASC